jgi:glycosyltransferase involved in cell wall biosynthesis
LERRKGVLELADAVRAMPEVDLQLTFVGHDTYTAPAGRSMHEALLEVLAGDPRARFVDRVSRDDAAALVADADLAVLPSYFEWWANVAQEAMAVGTPILATPVGGYVEQVVPDVSGWLTDDVGSPSLARSLGGLLAEPERLADLRGGGSARRHLAALTDPTAVLEGYRQLLARPVAPR